MSGEPIKLLLIDQFEADRARLLQCLKKASAAFECFEAPSGKVGLDLFKNLLPAPVHALYAASRRAGAATERRSYQSSLVRGRPARPSAAWTQRVWYTLRRPCRKRYAAIAR